MADAPTATIVVEPDASPVSGAPTARIVSRDDIPSGNYRITEDGETRAFEDDTVEELDS